MKRILILLLSLFLVMATALGQEIYPVTYRLDSTVNASPGGSIALKVTFDIQKEWYVYAPNGANESQGMMETKVLFKLPSGFSFGSKLQLPASGFKNGAEVFQGKGVALSRLVTVDKSMAVGTYEIEATVMYQTCNQETCLSPVSEKRKIKVVISPSAMARPAEGKGIELKFTALDGRQVNADRLKGKLLLIHCWATWCRPCIDEFGVLKSLYSKYHSKGLEIVGISADEHGALERVKSLIKSHGISWPQSFEGKPFAGNSFVLAQGISALPAVFLIGRDGKLISRDPKATELERLVGQHIGN